MISGACGLKPETLKREDELMSDKTKTDEETASPLQSLVKPCAWTMQEMMNALPLTADGKAIIPGMKVFCIAGNCIDERQVIGPYGKQALLTSEPARHGTCAGSSHRLADTVYVLRENALTALKV